MRKLTCLASLLLLVSIGCASVLFACGDKFLVASRGTRFQVTPALRKSAAILLYTNPASDVGKAIANLSVGSTLREAGYRFTVADTEAEFEKALRQGGWNLIIVSLADAEGVSKRVQGNTNVLPVVINATPEEMKQTRKQYPVVLKAPTKSQPFLAVIDEALAYRAKEGRPRTGKI